MSIEKKIEQDVDEMNDDIREDHGVRCVLCVDSIIDDFCNDNELDYDEDLCGNSDEDGSMWALYRAWGKGRFTSKKLAKLADEARKENARDLRTQAGEMGFHDYSSENGGTYYPSDSFPNYY
tara:strand:- start:14957 stop:15322 length:366 start_codon:yes stop_codon:yes gene_type:complete